MFALQASTQIQMKVIRKKKNRGSLQGKERHLGNRIAVLTRDKAGIPPPLVKLWLIGLKKDPLNSFRKKLKERKLILLHPT